MSNDNTQSNYFDLHVAGFGYLNDARVVPVKRGDDFLSVRIAALHGSKDDPQKTYFDAKVNGADAKAIISAFKDQINDRESKVLAGFKLSDLYVDTFTYQRGEKQGQTGVALKTRLLKIQWLKINGNDIDLTQLIAAESDDAYSQDVRTPSDDDGSDVTESDQGNDMMPLHVSLDPKADDFHNRKAELKEAGYRWNPETAVWDHPSVVQSAAA